MAFLSISHSFEKLNSVLEEDKEENTVNCVLLFPGDEECKAWDVRVPS